MAESLWASSKTMRSHSWARCSSMSWRSSSRASLSRRAMSRSLSSNGLPRRRALIRSRGEDVEVEVELLVELRLPLLDERPGRDDQAALEGAADDELADEEPGHDRLAGARVVREEEAQRLARQHRLVDGGDLVRQRLDDARGDREVRVEEVGEVDALRLGGQAEERAVAVEAPGPALSRRSSRRGSRVAVEDLGAHGAVGELVGQLDRVRAVPLGADDGGEPGGDESADHRPRRERFELRDAETSIRRGPPEVPTGSGHSTERPPRLGGSNVLLSVPATAWVSPG